MEQFNCDIGKNCNEDIYCEMLEIESDLCEVVGLPGSYKPQCFCKIYKAKLVWNDEGIITQEMEGE